MLVKVQVPGHVARTKRGSVRKQTRDRLIREARFLEPAIEQYAAVEIEYETDTSPFEREHTTVTFDTTKPYRMGF